jgi:hypothetical protein
MPAHLKRATPGTRFPRSSAAATIGDIEKYHHGMICGIGRNLLAL